MCRTLSMAVAMAAVAAGLTAAADVVGTVDFREEVGVVRPELHSSGLTPRSSERAIQNDDEAIRSLKQFGDTAQEDSTGRDLDWETRISFQHSTQT